MTRKPVPHTHRETQDSSPLLPAGPVPSARQLKWHQMEFYGFIHFTVNAFTDREWGYGDESPSVFAPTELDARQWARVARDGGMKGLILTCKHHDGFCLWPSARTEHSVKNSPWKNGKGDVVRDLSEACAEAGLRFGVYLSPWDRNHPEYGRPAYITYYRDQLRELLSGYGPIFGVWFDGANGGDGYYGGAKEKREIDRTTYYGWQDTWALARDLQPEAVLMSDAGPDIRWVGNEDGIAGDPCWATYTPHGKDGHPPAPGSVLYEQGTNGHSDGAGWMPAECDVSIRPGWFHHPAEDSRVKTVEELMRIYYHSVGRGASLLLNLPPDRRGLISPIDADRLLGFRRQLDATFKDDLAVSARVDASSTLGARYSASHVIGGDLDTYWVAAAGAREEWIELSWDRPVSFDHVLLQEQIALGQRVRSWTVEVESAGGWNPLGAGAAIGWKYILRCAPTSARRLRVLIREATAPPALLRVGVFLGKRAP